MKKWYVIKTQASYEKKVRDNIERNIKLQGLADFADEIIVPTYTEVEIKNDKRKESEKKIYPGFVLAHIEMTDNVWFAIRNTSGVFGLLGSSGGGTKPLPLDEFEVKKFVEKQGQIVYKNSNVKKGDKVEVLKNDFKGLKGVIESVNKDDHSVEVLLEGKSIYVTFGEIKID